MPPKTRKSVGMWFQCEKCAINILQKDTDRHEKDCPPNSNNCTYEYIKNDILYGRIDVKTNEDIKGLSQSEKDNVVFLSQSVIQLCSLSIGDWAEIRSDQLSAPIARTVWPTSEKTITSVLLTKNSLEFLTLKQESPVVVGKIKSNIEDAKLVTLILLNNRCIELSTEIHIRIQKLYQERLLAVGNKISITFFGKPLKFEVKAIDGNKTETGGLIKQFGEISIYDKEFFQITSNTKFVLYSSEIEYDKEVLSKDLFTEIGGLDDEITEIKSLINSALGFTKSKINIKPTRGCLLYGNPGTGKTLLANALARSSGAFKASICAADLYTKSGGNSEDVLKDLFQEVIDNAPSVLILDEFDILCPSRSNRLSDIEKRIVSQVLTLFENINKESLKIFVLGTSNRIDSIDPAFRRCGRFDREIEIPTPNPKSRFHILKQMSKGMVKDEELLKEVAYAAHGFVGADLAALCSRAAMHASQELDKSSIESDDWKFALTKIRPSAMREVQIEVPDVKWSEIGGQEKLKLILKQAVEWPLKHAESFIRMGITPPRGVLMFGPPGCSKTMVAKALATESGLNFLSIKGPELFSKWVGESERAVREVFRKARQVAPSIIFFDEIDALGGERSSGSATSVQERVLAQLLTELDGVSPLGDVTILAATNRPDRIDKALLRPGRLDRLVYVPLPDENTRRDIFKIKLSKMPVVGDVDIGKLVELTENYSGAEVNAVCHEAAMAALEEDINAAVVEFRHFVKALDLVAPRTSKSLIDLYEQYVNK